MTAQRRQELRDEIAALRTEAIGHAANADHHDREEARCTREADRLEREMEDEPEEMTL